MNKCPECGRHDPFYHCHERCSADEHVVTCNRCKTDYTTTQSLTEYQRMARIFKFNPDLYAERLKRVCKSKVATVQVLDSDLHLVIRVYEGTPEEVESGDAEVLGEHDTGADGNEYSPEADKLADDLVASLNAVGVTASKYQWQES